MKLIVVTHYPKDDPKFYSDYFDIEIFVVKFATGSSVRTKIAEFGDSYHDDGHSKMHGFIQGVEWAIAPSLSKFTVDYEDIADRED